MTTEALTPEQARVRAATVAVLKGALLRLDGVHITGPKRRADALLHIICGAAGMAEAIGDSGMVHSMTAQAMLISIRGEEEVARYLKLYG